MLDAYLFVDWHLPAWTLPHLSNDMYTLHRFQLNSSIHDDHTMMIYQAPGSHEILMLVSKEMPGDVLMSQSSIVLIVLVITKQYSCVTIKLWCRNIIWHLFKDKHQQFHGTQGPCSPQVLTWYMYTMKVDAFLCCMHIYVHCVWQMIYEIFTTINTKKRLESKRIIWGLFMTSYVSATRGPGMIHQFVIPYNTLIN